MPTTRRRLLEAGASLAAVLAARRIGLTAEPGTASPTPLPVLRTTRKGDMLYRPLGRTGEAVSVIGLGGHHIGRPSDEQEGISLVRAAIDRGITFMDNSWDYHDGGSEIRMGKVLRDGYRENVFLMTKIDGRTRDAAAKQIDDSLARLQTDHIDLLQHHEVIRLAVRLQG